MPDPIPKRRRLQYRLRTLLLGVLLASLLAPYVGSYYRLSGKGVAESGEPLSYVPVGESYGGRRTLEAPLVSDGNEKQKGDQGRGCPDCE